MKLKKLISFFAVCMPYFLRAFRVVTVVVLASVIGIFCAKAKAPQKPIWAAAAMPLDLSCMAHSSAIVSPDRRSSVRVVCRTVKGRDPMYSLELQILNGHVYHLSLTAGAEEVLWAPDSKAFFVNGGESAYGGFYVLVYVLGDEGPPRKLDITQAAQRDMVNSFPPCRALYHDPKLCHMMSANPEYNMSGIKWDKASSAIFVFAEVPPSSSYGGIMGQVLGYQLGLPDGRVLQKFSAQQVSRQWSSFMAWRMHIPDPPAYDQSR